MKLLCKVKFYFLFCLQILIVESTYFNVSKYEKYGGRYRKEVDGALEEHVRNLILHFKQDDPVGLPPHLRSIILDPMKIPRLEQQGSGYKIVLDSSSVYGLSKFRLDHIKSDLSALKISLGVSIDELEVKGKYSLASFFSTSKGNFSVQILKVLAEAEGFFIVDPDGVLQVQTITMDLKFSDIKMNFENLGLLGKVFQGLINSVGTFLFDSIKPIILQQVQGDLRGVLNREARSVPQQFPNSINPLDMAIAAGRNMIRERGYDPFELPNYSTESWSHFELSEGELHGLSTIHRTGSIILGFEKNSIYITLHLGVQNLYGKYNWTVGVFRNFLTRRGVLGFTLEYISAEIKLRQPANLDKLPSVEGIDLEIGNIAVLSDGAGTLDYIVEAGCNILPNLFRKQIIDSIEPILCRAVEEELQKLNVEEMIEQSL